MPQGPWRGRCKAIDTRRARPLRLIDVSGRPPPRLTTRHDASSAKLAPRNFPQIFRWKPQQQPRLNMAPSAPFDCFMVYATRTCGTPEILKHRHKTIPAAAPRVATRRRTLLCYAGGEPQTVIAAEPSHPPQPRLPLFAAWLPKHQPIPCCWWTTSR